MTFTLHWASATACRIWSTQAVAARHRRAARVAELAGIGCSRGCRSTRDSPVAAQRAALDHVTVALLVADVGAAVDADRDAARPRPRLTVQRWFSALQSVSGAQARQPAALAAHSSITSPRHASRRRPDRRRRSTRTCRARIRRHRPACPAGSPRSRRSADADVRPVAVLARVDDAVAARAGARQPEKSSVQSGRQASVPPFGQLPLPRSAPSHCSSPPTAPSPHTGRAPGLLSRARRDQRGGRPGRPTAICDFHGALLCDDMRANPRVELTASLRSRWWLRTR